MRQGSKYFFVVLKVIINSVLIYASNALLPPLQNILTTTNKIHFNASNKCKVFLLIFLYVVFIP